MSEGVLAFVERYKSTSNPVWLRDREDSPWYASARLYRQPEPGDWDAVLRRIEADLGGTEIRLTEAQR